MLWCGGRVYTDIPGVGCKLTNRPGGESGGGGGAMQEEPSAGEMSTSLPHIPVRTISRLCVAV